MSAEGGDFRVREPGRIEALAKHVPAARDAQQRPPSPGIPFLTVESPLLGGTQSKQSFQLASPDHDAQHGAAHGVVPLKSAADEKPLVEPGHAGIPELECSRTQ